MFKLDSFISEHVTHRSGSLFAEDLAQNGPALRKEIEGSSICVIGGAGSIGSSFIKAALPFRPRSVVVIDLNENGLAELVRDVRSTYGLYVPDEFAATPSITQTPSSNAYSAGKTDSTLSLISPPTSTYAAKRTATAYRP